jgi:peroxiredoxin Q/BCP
MSLTLLTLALTLADAPKVEEGKPAPDVTLDAVTAKGTSKVSLSSFKGKKNVVLFFYPRAMTPGCTKESCGFSELLKKFEDLDTVVFGISTDKTDAQGKFIEKEKLTIPLFADPEGTVTKAFGSMRPTGTAANRDTFIIDKDGNVKKIYRAVKDAAKHPEEVLGYVKENIKK